ncbi:MAG: TRAP transporter small permease [Oceanibaculum nanhaiense]|nr:TRAP transporter small permease [Oceanibaculum nanhaiense]
MNWFDTTSRMLRWLEWIAIAGGAVCSVAIMTIVGADVFARYALNRPIAWSYDLISLFLLTGVFYLSLADTQRSGEHMAVDIVHNLASSRQRHAMYAISYALALPVVWLMMMGNIRSARRAFLNNEVLMGAVAWPTWVASFIVAVGLALLLLRLAHSFAGHALSVAVRADLIPLPQKTGSQEGSGL